MKTSTARTPDSTNRHRGLVGRRDVVPIISASIAAGGVLVLCWSTIGWHHVLGVGLVTYGVFVAVLAGAEVMRAPDPNEPEVIHAADLLRRDVDLAGAERADRSELPSPHDWLPLALVVDDEADRHADVDRPERRRPISGKDVAEGLVAALSGAAFAELLRIVFKMQSLVGLAIWWYAAFLVVYFLLVRDRSDIEAAIDRVVTVVVWSVAVLVAAVLTWMVLYVVVQGYHRLRLSFLTEDLSKVGPLTPGGGAKHAIIGTLEQVGIATIVVVPIAILTAIYLHEIHGRLARPIRFIVDAMSGLPSIVAGLLIFTVVVQPYGYSGLAGAFALMVLMLPTVTRASEEILRTIPDTLREGALALGAPRWRLVQKVVVPTALAGLVTAAILGVARAIGETAPMLLTALGTDRTVTSPTGEPQSDLPLFVWKLIKVPDKTQNERAWTGALVLMILVFVLFTLARIVANRGQRRLRRVR